MPNEGDFMKYLSLVLFFCSAYTMDPTEAPQRAQKRCEKYNLFLQALQFLEKENTDTGHEPIITYPTAVVVLKHERPEIKKHKNHIAVRSFTGIISPRMVAKINAFHGKKSQ